MGVVKGKALIGQSGGPTCAVNQSLLGIIEELIFYEEVDAIWGARHGVKGILKEDFIDLRRESKATLRAVANTPGAGLGSVRQKPTAQESERVFEICRKHGVRYLFYIGGNDSAEAADIINEVAKQKHYELRVFHCPKTIDNDLAVTDHCPGYGSAAKFVAMAFMGDNCDTRALPGIKINIVMGRHAGWLTASSMLARQHKGDGPHLIYVPERALTIKQFVKDVQAVYDKLGRCVVAVSEGVHDGKGKTHGSTGEKDVFGNVQLSGTGMLGAYLSSVVKEKVKAKDGKAPRVRADTFGYCQRSFPGAISEVDVREAYEVGAAAARYAVKEDTDGSVALVRVGDGEDYACEPKLVALSLVAKHTRTLPSKYINRAGNNINESFRRYVEPLAGKLPQMGILEGHKVRV